MTTAIAEPLMNADQVAAILGCSASTVREYTHTEGLPFVRMKGNIKRYRPEKVRAWIAGREASVRPETEAPVIEVAKAPAMAGWDGIRRAGGKGKKKP